MSQQQGDVKLFQTNNEGDVSVVAGIIEMSGGLETAAYLSLFGGNEDDDGRADNSANWWGNLDEIDTARQYRSELQHLIESLPLITGNLRRIEAAAIRDLAWFLETKVANKVEVVATIPALNTVKLDVAIEAVGEESRFEFVENWKATPITIESVPVVVSLDNTFRLLEDGGARLLEDGGNLELELDF